MSDAGLLNRQSLSEQIKAALLDRILRGVLKPGDRLIELKIAEEMDTSQAPVREALRELEAIGIIETRRNKGARVRVIDDQEQAEIYAVRAELEGFGTALATARAPQVADDLVACIADMERCAKDGDPIRFAQMNSEFHRIIMRASGNGTLHDLWSRLDVRSRTLVNVSRQRGDLERIARSHGSIVDAIRSGDVAAARMAAEDHVRTNAPADMQSGFGGTQAAE